MSAKPTPEQRAQVEAKRQERSRAVDMTKVSFRLSQAKAALMIEQPFYSTLLARLELIPDHAVSTMKVNGKCIRYSPLMVSEMSLPETKFVLCHEVLHPVLQHTTRRGGRDHKKWNAAGDFVINNILVAEGIGEMPKEHPGLHNPLLVEAGKTTEGVYNLLPDGDDDGGSGGGGNDPGWGDGEGDLEDNPGSEAEQAQDEAETKVAVAQAAQAARARGRLSAAMERLVQEVLQPKVDWQAVLWRFASERVRVDTSYARPNKRALEVFDLVLPSRSGERLGGIVAAVDCSGSVSEEALSQVGAELKAIQQTLRPAQIDVIYWDAAVKRHDIFGPEEEIVLHPVGGGGTVFSPVTEFVADHDITPVCMVVLTDLCISAGDFGNPPDYPVLWVSTDRDAAPWGEVTKMQ